MANPQKEQGYTAIANELVEQFCKLGLSAYETRVLWAILRKTFGWRKKSDYISISQLQELTGLHRRNVSRAKTKLLVRNIILQENGLLGLNKNYDTWNLKVSSKQTTETIVYRDTRPKGFPPLNFAFKNGEDTFCERCCFAFKFSQTEEHHIIPKEFGGNDLKENLARLCITCHKMTHAEINRIAIVDLDDTNKYYRQFVSLLSSKQTMLLSSIQTHTKEKKETKQKKGDIFPLSITKKEIESLKAMDWDDIKIRDHFLMRGFTEQQIDKAIHPQY